jgi:hypothetical protein
MTRSSRAGSVDRRGKLKISAHRPQSGHATLDRRVRHEPPGHLPAGEGLDDE